MSGPTRDEQRAQLLAADDDPNATALDQKIKAGAAVKAAKAGAAKTTGK